MIRIGIFGTDNSHSIGFSRFFNVKEEKNKVPGAKVVAVYGLEEKRTAEVAEKGQIPTIVKRPQDALKMIDAAIVDFRHGSRHWKYAKMCIQAGIPTFIDKPFASSVADAKKIIALAKKKRVPITTFSTIRFGTAMEEFKKQLKGIGKVKALVITAPGSSHDPYDGIFFYAVHQVELMLEAFGNKIESVRGMDYDGMLQATVVYKNGMIATLHEINTGWPRFMATAYGENGEAVYDGAKRRGRILHRRKDVHEDVQDRQDALPGERAGQLGQGACRNTEVDGQQRQGSEGQVRPRAEIRGASVRTPLLFWRGKPQRLADAVELLAEAAVDRLGGDFAEALTRLLDAAERDLAHFGVGAVAVDGLGPVGLGVLPASSGGGYTAHKETRLFHGRARARGS